jgi:DNA-binding NarL/FixJ family response regulator
LSVDVDEAAIARELVVRLDAVYRRKASTTPTIATTAATKQTDPTATSSHRGCRLIQEVHLVICRRTKVATALAQGNSVAQIANPRKITSQPGPGMIKNTIPVTTTARPATAIPTRQMW